MFFSLMARVLGIVSEVVGPTRYAAARGLLGGNLFQSKLKNRILSAFNFRLSGPMYNALRPLFNVSFINTQKWRNAVTGKSRIFFTSKEGVAIKKRLLPFSPGSGWDTHHGGFLKWYLKKYGGNTFLDAIISPTNQPNHRQATEVKRMGGTKTNKNFKNGTVRTLSDVIEGALKAYQISLNDPALNSKQELKRAYGMMNVKDPRNTPVISTSFPQAPMSWMNSGLYSDKTNYAAFTTQKGYMFSVHMNLNGFKSMSRSVHPGKVLWNGPWFFKRRKTLKLASVRRLGRRKGLI